MMENALIIEKRKDTDSYFAHESADISPHAKIGAGTKIWNSVHIRERAIIGMNCNLGKGVYIDADVVVGNNVKIQNYVSVYKGIVIQDDVFLGPYCSFTNDLYPRAFSNDWQISPTIIMRGVSVGANATIVCGITIGEFCMIAAGSVVTSHTLPYSLMVGNPARLKNFVCQCGHPARENKRGSLNIVFECNHCQKKFRINYTLEV